MTALSLIQSILAEDPISPGGRLAMSTVERLAALVPEWRGIESAPKDGTPFLAFQRGVRNATMRRAQTDAIRVDRYPNNQRKRCWLEMPEAPYTHFMTLPEAPKETS